jgi:hypothetical protein
MNPSPPNFSLIQGQVPWVNKDGTPTTYFFRLLQNIFLASGGGTPPSVTDITNVTFSQNGASGPDYSRQIADLAATLQSQPNPAGRIATLERQVADLQAIILTLERGIDLTPLQSQINNLNALVMGVAH